VKVLLNKYVERLSQIKWFFDGKKINKADLEVLKNRIKTLDIPPTASAKFNLNTIDELKKEIERNFDNIFQVQ
jgi:hypothetical protein